MIDTVPKEVQLSRVITPIPLKPDNIFIAVDESGDMTISGDIRIQIDDKPVPASRKVLVHFNPRFTDTPAIAGAIASKLEQDTTGLHPYSPSFGWWNFTMSVPISQGLASFTVEVLDDGSPTMHTNGGTGFPVETDIIPQARLSCSAVYMGKKYSLNLTVTVRDDALLQKVILTVPIPVKQEGSIVPGFEPYVLNMEKTGVVLESTGYSLYTASLDVRPSAMYVTIMSYGLSGRGEGARDVEVPFVLWKGFASCPYECNE
ncbi:hypothetical protein C8A00DRAFT_29724 [Chaetomidium leptoderma]|uniref:Uncharacterized protein n=1 Tax=Chaetomidium leptoderma TaxID=669021 RepID=A0AAN7A0V3_9PEZI|nr:hypothetical protein C8A00DRAFT_29724 [Chaetomidium leptoderma]